MNKALVFFQTKYKLETTAKAKQKAKGHKTTEHVLGRRVGTGKLVVTQSEKAPPVGRGGQGRDAVLA